MKFSSVPALSEKTQTFPVPVPRFHHISNEKKSKKSEVNLGASQSRETVERDLTLIEEMGANYIRMAHYPHDIKELIRARERGILLSEEIPYYSVGMGFTQWFEEATTDGSTEKQRR